MKRIVLKSLEGVPVQHQAGLVLIGVTGCRTELGAVAAGVAPVVDDGDLVGLVDSPSDGIGTTERKWPENIEGFNLIGQECPVGTDRDAG